ncbi:MAG: flagellar motor switch phosphatase FliY [Butyrivibrio sp.]|nr:flagellar motor switch phosphatase FliY [Butyrivibrio sp.]
MDGMLSQDEINALFNNVGDTDDTEIETPVDDGETLTEEQKDAIGEVSNISMGTAATTLSTLLNQPVNITTPNVTYMMWDELAESYDKPCVFLQIKYTCGLDGNNVLVLIEKDVKIITDLMMGGSGVASDEPISELHLSAIGEAMNQMMGSAATSMSSMLGKKIDISPPIASLIDLNETKDDALPEFLSQRFVKVSFRMTIGDLIDSEIMQLYPFDFARSLFETFASGVLDDSGFDDPEPAPAPAPEMADNTMQQPEQPQQMAQGMEQMPYGQPMMPGYGMPPMGGYMQPQMPYGQPMMPGYGMPPQQPNVNVQPASFQPFTGPSIANGNENIDLIMDVPLEVTVELGRTSKSIKDILDFTPGTIVELNKIAGEPIDILVNGKYVAKGEVVVIEESFGVKITEIIK